MGQSKEDREAAVQRYKDARANLATVSRKSRDETPEFWDANSAVIEAEKDVPWWRRLT